jgi:gliding motility-associated protein GldM
MAGGKETPRQKMIGMMYLVLTALLALNVSAEILNAFVLVDNSLTKTGENYKKKNDAVYTAFNAAYELNKGKVGPYKTKADEVAKLTNSLFDQIFEIKKEIVKRGDKSDAEYIKKGPSAVKAKDDNNIPSEIMILKGKGKELKDKINSYREKLLSYVNARDEGLIKSIKATLNTDDMEREGEGGKVAWEYGNFYQLPLSGVLTMLSKVQTDLRNAESDIISYLFGQIEAGSFKFNKIEAIVNSKSSYVILGGKYEAEVFIAASDSTQAPRILVGGQPITVEKGKGKYTGGTGAIGIKKWGGVIELEHPVTKEVLKYPFESEYQVAQPSLVVSPTKMNVFYVGVDNPVDISVAGVPEDKIIPTISQGKISKNPNGAGYIVRVDKPGVETMVGATAKFEQTTKDMGSVKFRVKRVPDPVAKVAKKTGGMITKNELLAQSGVVAELENFDFDLKFRIIGFAVTATIKGYTDESRTQGATFTAEQLKLIKSVPTGQKVYIDNIRAQGPDGVPRDLPSISLKLN